MSIIEVKNISKKYTLAHQDEKYLTLRDKIAGIVSHPIKTARKIKRQKQEEFWALKDISFNVEQGEIIGIIGANGAGKSTLLKILSQITPPTSGEIKIKGKVASLLEVGTGFHPELTGRENIFLNGAILGMAKKEIEKKFNEIVEFSGIEKFLDTPVKRYSSGMYVRLAFSVAAHMEPDILLIDEVLAVGDAEFQKKCLGKMGEVTKKAGRTIIFISHNMAAVRSLCKRCVLLENGKITLTGDTEKVVNKYLFSRDNNGGMTRNWPKGEEPGNETIKLVRVCLKNEKKVVSNQFFLSENITIEIIYNLLEKNEDMSIFVTLIAEDGNKVFTSGDCDNGNCKKERKIGENRIECVIPGNLLNIGFYFLKISSIVPMRKINFAEENVMRMRIIADGSCGSNIIDNRAGCVRPILNWNTVK